MTMIAITKCETIKSKYEGKELVLVRENAALNWNRSPLLITASEKATMHFNHVMAIMQKRTQAPSVLANLNQEALPAKISRIDNLYYENMESYIELLQLACRDDLNKLKKLKKEYRFNWLKTASGGAAVLTAVGAASGSAFGLVGAIPGSALGFLTGFITGAITGKKIWKALRLRNGSANRIKCMQAIDVLEKKRLKDTKGILESGGKALLREIKELEQDNECSTDQVLELYQLALVHRSLFPNELYVLSGTHVFEYLQELKEKFAPLQEFIN